MLYAQKFSDLTKEYLFRFYAILDKMISGDDRSKMNNSTRADTVVKTPSAFLSFHYI